MFPEGQIQSNLAPKEAIVFHHSMNSFGLHWHFSDILSPKQKSWSSPADTAGSALKNTSVESTQTKPLSSVAVITYHKDPGISEGLLFKFCPLPKRLPDCVHTYVPFDTAEALKSNTSFSQIGPEFEAVIVQLQFGSVSDKMIS